MPGNKQKAGQFLSLEASSWISLSELWSFTLTVFKEIILINITQKIHQITANPRPHYHWNNQSIFCAVLSTSSYPCICTHFATCLLYFSLLEQPPKEVNKQVLELVERRGQDCMTMTMREKSKTESFHSHSGLSGWLCTYDWTTDPLSPRRGRSRVAPCHHKKSKEGKVIYSFFCCVYSSSAVYFVPYLASAVSVWFAFGFPPPPPPPRFSRRGVYSGRQVEKKLSRKCDLLLF